MGGIVVKVCGRYQIQIQSTTNILLAQGGYGKVELTEPKIQEVVFYYQQEKI